MNCGKFSMENKSKYDEKNTNISSTETSEYDSEAHQPLEKEFDGKTATNTPESTETLYTRKAFETETNAEKHRESLKNQKDDEQDKYQIKKPKRKVIKAKLIND